MLGVYPGRSNRAAPDTMTAWSGPPPARLRRFQAGDGTELAVYAVGQGPPLLLIPGLGTDHHAFVWNIRA